MFGAFEVVGTFDMHSTYSIDSGTPTDFLPAETVVRPLYRQKFYQSGMLSNGDHTLVITNAAQEFWFDYVEVTQLSASTTTAASAVPQKPQTPPSSTAQTLRSTASQAAASPAGGPGTTQPVSSPSSQAQSTHSFSNAGNVTLTSTNAAGMPPLHSSSATQSQTLVLASGAASPTGTAALAHSSKLSAGAIIGLAFAGLLVFIPVGWVAYRWWRRGQPRRQDDLAPYGALNNNQILIHEALTSRMVFPSSTDPGLTAFAFKPSEKTHLEHDDSSRDSMAASRQSVPQPAPAYAHPPLEARASGTSGERTVPHEIVTVDLEEARMGGGRDRRTGFEPLGSPSSASPLLPLRSPGMRHHKDSQITPSVGASRYLSSLDERRSIDGGVRLAGGPMEGGGGDDARSGVSTLPPAYGSYPGV